MSTSLFTRALCLSALVAGCGADPAGETFVDDTSSATAVSGKADAVILSGTWVFQGTRLRGDDLGYLQLLDDGRYLRTVCLDAACQRYAPGDGRMQLTVGNNGRRYVRFGSGGANHAGTVPFDATSVLDVYAWRMTRGGDLQLRKANTARWFTLSRATDEEVCGASSGAWDTAQVSSNGTHCDCGAGNLFSPGQGGCIAAPTPSEALCDGTKGSWCDDDNNLLLTYCECPGYQVWQDGTGCVDL